MEKLFNCLKEIGLNSYESKVYIALLRKYPATGYEISKLANVPQARAYDTLKALEQKQIVICSNSKPAEYTPVNPKELIKKFKKQINSTLDYLDKNLPQVKEHSFEPIEHINGFANVHSKLIEMIKNAKNEIFIEAWSDDFTYLEKELREAYNRNVEVKIVGYNNLKTNFGLVYSHPFTKNIENILNGRMILVVVDNKESAIGLLQIKGEREPYLMCTQAPLIVFLHREFVIHDMFVLDMQDNLFEEIKETYGKGMKRLHDRVLGAYNIFN